MWRERSKNIWDLMNTSYDKFIRTTDEYHEKQVQKIFKKLYEKAISIRAIMRAFTVRPASPSGPRPRWWTESAPTAAVRYSLQRRRHTSSV